MGHGLEFEWDPVKARTNLRKHHVSFVEAATVFGDPLSLTDEEVGPHAEVRLYTLGMSVNGRVLVVVHGDREEKIRIISARLATKQERRTYEKGT